MAVDQSGGGADGPATAGAGGGTEFAPGTLGAFRTAVKLVEAGLEQLKKGWEDLVDAVNGLLGRVQDWLNSDSVWATVVEWWTSEIGEAVAAIRAKIEEIKPKIIAFLTKIQQAVNGSVPVVSLFQVALDWGTKVDPPLSELAPDMTGSGKIDNWRGPAKLTYEKRVADQIEASDTAVAKVKATANWLGDVGTGNAMYMASLAELVCPLANQIVALALNIAETAAGAVTQVVITLETVSAAVGQAVEMELTYAIRLGSRFAEVLGQIEQLATEWGDHSGLPGGQWPQSVKA
jgi:hypothetical protein